MYIALDSNEPSVLYKSESAEVVCGLAFLEAPETQLYLFPLQDACWFKFLTTAKLHALASTLAKQDIDPSAKRTALTHLVFKLCEKLKPTRCVERELISQIVHFETVDGAFRYHLGKSLPIKVKKGWTPESLSCNISRLEIEAILKEEPESLIRNYDGHNADFFSQPLAVRKTVNLQEFTIQGETKYKPPWEKSC